VHGDALNGAYSHACAGRGWPNNLAFPEALTKPCWWESGARGLP